MVDVHTHMLKILIADDEIPARNRLKDLLADIGNNEIIGEAQNGKEALLLCENLHPDIMLLDIRMPIMTGIETAAHLQGMQAPPAIIFTTAHDDFAVKAFEMNAIDYLLKPIRHERLQVALQKAQKLMPKQLAGLNPLSPVRTHLSIVERGRIILIPIDDIIYFRAELKYVTVRTAVREFLMEASLTQLEREFGTRFTRLHRNCLAATSAIIGYEKRTIAGHAEKQWVALLKEVPETILVSRRQYHVIRAAS